MQIAAVLRANCGGFAPKTGRGFFCFGPIIYDRMIIMAIIMAYMISMTMQAIMIAIMIIYEPLIGFWEPAILNKKPY